MRKGKATFKAVQLFEHKPTGVFLLGYSHHEVFEAIPEQTAPHYWRILEKRGKAWHVVQNNIRKPKL